MKLGRAAMITACILALVYVSVLLVAVAAKPHLTFLPMQRSIASCFPSKVDVFVTSQGARVHGWFVPGNPGYSGKHVLFAHGNGGNVSYYQAQVSLFLELGCSVWTFDYPGFGQSEGRPTEAGCHSAAYAFYEEVRKVAEPNDIVLAGFSLGGAVAGRLATRVPHHALVLIATFVNPRYLVKTIAWPLWLWSFVATEFDLEADLRTLAHPTRAAIYHSRTDGLIDFCHAERNAATLGCPVVEIGGWHGEPLFDAAALDNLRTVIHASECLPNCSLPPR